MLLRSALCFAQLKIEEDTRHFSPGNFSEEDYLKWRSVTFKHKPELIPEPTTCYDSHKDQCNFIADVYLEFLDRQYAKRTGYRRYREGDFNFDFCYKDFLHSVDYNDHWELEPVIKESEGHISKPVCDFYKKAYIRHSVDYFFPFLADSYFFLPDWGLWWERDNRNEKNKLNCFFSDSCWSHPDPPE